MGGIPALQALSLWDHGVGNGGGGREDERVVRRTERRCLPEKAERGEVGGKSPGLGWGGIIEGGPGARV